MGVKFGLSLTLREEHRLSAFDFYQIFRAGHVERMGKIKMHNEFWSENLKGRGHAEDLSVDGR